MCKFGNSDSTYEYYGDQYTAFVKKTDDWTGRASERSGLNIVGTPMTPFLVWPKIQLSGPVNSIQACKPEITSDSDFVQIQAYELFSVA